MELKKKTILSLLPGSTFRSVDSLILHHQRRYAKKDCYKPIGIEVEITNLCNLRCRGCALIVDEINKPEDTLTENHFQHILRDCSALGMFAYSITGGEPFLKFPLVQSLISGGHGLDIYKLNTNATYFKTESLASDYFEKLKNAGFADNRFIKSVLVISLGHQNLAGVPIRNAVNATKLFYEFFSADTSTCVLNITEKNSLLAHKIYEDFTLLYAKIAGKRFDEALYQVRFFGLNYVPTLTRLAMLSGPKIPIADRIEEFKGEYLSGGCFNIRVMNHEIPDQSETLVPRCVLRPNGDVYACPGYNRTHNIGNIGAEPLRHVIRRVNKTALFKTVFTKNLEGLYKMALRINPDTKNIEVERGYGPCDVCQILTGIITKKPILWPKYATLPAFAHEQ